MDYIAKPTARLLATLLHSYGVRRVVLSPGSRCAPLSLTLARDGRFAVTVVIDERSAAFVGLGMAVASGEPVALVCTSGSAVLNYAPALAEAFYRRVPLVAVSADRPAGLIDVRDSQTIRQSGALGSVVRCSVDIPDDGSRRAMRYAGRRMCDALSAATGRVKGPVHINMQFDAPLTPLTDALSEDFEAMKVTYPTVSAQAIEIHGIKPDSKVLVVAADLPRSERLRSAAEALQDRCVVFAEAQSKLPGIRDISFEGLPKPDVVVTLGGSVVDARLKAYLRRLDGLKHISLGYDDNFADTFGALVERVECDPAPWLEALASRLKPDGTFTGAWNDAVRRRSCRVTAFLQSLADAMPGSDWHFSNGCAVRYAQKLMFDASACVESNRGVSGIEGSTSTAIGAAMVSERPVVLVGGDMSAAYDIGALAMGDIPSSFSMVVLDNGGGDIFRAIGTTSPFDECERLFATPPRLPLEALARAYGFDYFECTPADAVPAAFVEMSTRPRILRLIIPPASSRALFD